MQRRPLLQFFEPVEDDVDVRPNCRLIEVRGISRHHQEALPI